VNGKTASIAPWMQEHDACSGRPAAESLTTKPMAAAPRTSGGHGDRFWAAALAAHAAATHKPFRLVLAA
jgi:hypothetical protein